MTSIDRTVAAIRPMAANSQPSKKPIGFFVHHQGRGHVKRCEAIVEHITDRPITFFSADLSIFSLKRPNISHVELPNMIGAPSRTADLFDSVPPDIMHCVPVGVRAMTRHMGIMAQWMMEADPALFFIDVSAEIALLCRILSVPAIKVRMHGERSDTGHMGAYDCCTAMFAPYDERMEQPDYPEDLKRRTFYSGGLCTTSANVPGKAEARRRLGLPADQQIVLSLAGGGGSGTPLAPLTMAARAVRDAMWLTVGPVSREGHETEFANLRELGWVDDVTAYIAASDTVIASAGDNTVHEIARVGRPFLCLPEWRYFDEQHQKAAQLERLGAAAIRQSWPASTAQWRAALEAAGRCDLDMQRSLFDPQAGRKSADFLKRTADRLWAGSEEPSGDETGRIAAAE